jgi:hypothetical protein
MPTTFAELVTTLETRGALKPSRVKDIKTALKRLALAMGYAGVDTAPVGDACRDPAQWLPLLTTHYATLKTLGQTVSAVSQKSDRNHLRHVFRVAEAHGLLQAPLPPRLLKKPNRVAFWDELRKTSPYRSVYIRSGVWDYGLAQRDWPPDVVAGWQNYRLRCDGRIRETTFKGYAGILSAYLGYVAHILERTPVWEDVFDGEQIRAFVRWHAGRSQRKVSSKGARMAFVAVAIAKAVGHDNTEALRRMRNDLPVPAAVHDKDNHWIPLAQLDAVADACMQEGRIPPVSPRKHIRFPGARCASIFQKGLMLKILVRIPLRQRNLREMQMGMGKNLYQDPRTKHWVIRFHGDELKVGTKDNKENEYKVDVTTYAPELLKLLEEFRTVHRPKLPGAAACEHLFLTSVGRPYTGGSLTKELSDVVTMRTGVHFFPHMIRTIWATTYLTAPDTYGDFFTAAVMLGDRLQTVIKAYAHVLDDKHYAKARAFLDTALRAG